MEMWQRRSEMKEQLCSRGVTNEEQEREGERHRHITQLGRQAAPEVFKKLSR
jgi:hypothetical protein